jgi:hypothetical protein
MRSCSAAESRSEPTAIAHPARGCGTAAVKYQLALTTGKLGKLVE